MIKYIFCMACINKVSENLPLPANVNASLACIPIHFFAVDFSTAVAQVGVTFDPQYGCANGRAPFNYSASQAIARRRRAWCHSAGERISQSCCLGADAKRSKNNIWNMRFHPIAPLASEQNAVRGSYFGVHAVRKRYAGGNRSLRWPVSEILYLPPPPPPLWIRRAAGIFHIVIFPTILRAA